MARYQDLRQGTVARSTNEHKASNRTVIELLVTGKLPDLSVAVRAGARTGHFVQALTVARKNREVRDFIAAAKLAGVNIAKVLRADKRYRERWAKFKALYNPQPATDEEVALILADDSPIHPVRDLDEFPEAEDDYNIQAYP